jgi:hypothetical protein
MKLRQKLAMVLAATMVVTAVPVVTMATSTATITAGNTLVGTKNADLSQAVTLQVNITNAVTSGETFYITLDGAKFNNYNETTPKTYDLKSTSSNANNPVGTVTLTGDYDAKVVINQDLTSSTNRLTVTFNAGEIKLTSDTAKFVLDGAGSSVSDTTVTFATTSTAKATVSVSSTPTIYTDKPTMGTIVITEPYAGAFFNSKNAQVIKVQLKGSDYDFKTITKTTTSDYLVPSRGFSTSDGIQIEASDSLLQITIPAGLQSTTAGRITLKDVPLVANTKTPTTGNLKVKVSGDNISSAEYTVATVASYTAKLSVDSVEEISAGKTEEVTFTLGENLKNSIVEGRTITFTVDKGYFSKASVKANTNITGVDEVYDGNGTDDKNILGYQSFEYVVDDKTERSSTLVDQDFSLDLVTKLTTTAGDVTVTASGSRAIGDDVSVVVAKVETPVTVTSEAATLKVGLKGQSGGKITITETEAGKIEKGFIRVKLNGVDFDDEPTVKVTKGDIVLDLDASTFTVDGKYLWIPVKATSDEASTIEISNLPITVDRTLPEGTWNATVAFTGTDKATSPVKLDDDGKLADSTATSWNYGAFEGNNYYGTITLKDFIVIGTPNTEDITTSGLTKGTSTFVIGQTTYTVNGETKNMDAAAYASANGRTMAPIRYVADAFGINGNNIIVSGNTITLLAGTRTVQLTVGSNIAVLNGVEIPMDEAVTVIDGRSYAPLSQVGNLLGVSATWDAVTKTATFTNN